ncbi:glycosyltransferase [Vibrio vulnificus]
MKIKLLFVSPSFFPATKYGGPIFSTLNVCRELAKKNDEIEIEIHTTNANFDSRLEVNTKVPIELKELNGVRIHYHSEMILNRFSPSLLITLVRKIANFDIVHSQSIFSISTPVSIIMCFLLKKKIVVSPRGSLGEWCLEKRGFFKKLWLRLFFRPFVRSIYWHVTAENEASEVMRLFPQVGDNSILLIPNGINKRSDVYLDKDALFNCLKISGVESFIASSGRIDKKKGFDYTIRSLALIDNVHLIIMGEDYGEKQELIELSDKLGVSHRVHFVGHLDESLKWSLYKYADLFVLNSRHENFGNVYLEALSCGTPIVASTETPWHFINETDAGLCVENDPVKISSAIKMLLNEKSKREASCLQVSNDYYWDNIADKFILNYKRISNED